MSKPATGAILAVLGLAAATTATAQTPQTPQGLADPTHPPAEGPRADPKAPGPGGAKPQPRPEDVANPIQLVLVGKTRRYALVRGELVGEKAGETKLIEVGPTDVTVESDRGRETLSLFPGVEKTPPRKQRGMGY